MVTTMNRLQKVILYSVLVVGVLLSAGITATVGWRPFIGPRAPSFGVFLRLGLARAKGERRLRG